MPPIAVYDRSVGSDWGHVAVTYTDKQPRIYLNGDLVKIGLTSPKTNVYAPTHLGSRYFGTFNGSIKKVRIYSRPLTATEIEQNYLSNTGGCQ